MIILNLKNYKESSVDFGMQLLEAVNTTLEYSPIFLEKILVAPPIPNISWARANYPNIKIIAQHVDGLEGEKSTGYISPETISALGIDTCIINHSEHRLDFQEIPEYIQQLSDKAIKAIVCCENASEAGQLIKFNPYALAFEPKDLISSGVSVTTKEQEVKDFMDIVKNKSLAVIGAGITTYQDASACKLAGADGILLSSAFVKAENPTKKLQDFIDSFLK